MFARLKGPKIKARVAELPRQEVFEPLSGTSVLLYTVQVRDIPLGMPMSIIEAMRAGAGVITSGAPEMRALCGDG